MSKPLAPKEKSLGKIGEVRLDLIPSLSECRVGSEPTEYNVVVVVPRMEEKIGSILLPDDLRDQYEMAMQACRIVAVSPLAFNYDKWEGCAEKKPKAGDIIWIAKYAGTLFDGADGKQYRVIKDKDVGMIIPEVSTTVVETGDRVFELEPGLTSAEARGLAA